MKITKTEGAALAAAVATVAAAAGVAINDGTTAALIPLVTAIIGAVLKAASAFQSAKAA